MEEKKKPDFNELPFGEQMRILQVRRDAKALVKNLDEAHKRDKAFEALLECAREINDSKTLNAVLFSGAEYFEKLKPLPPDGHEYDVVKSKALDWLRHVLKKSPNSMTSAVNAIDHLTRGMFGDARKDFGHVRIREDEFEAVERYYRGVLP